MGKTKCLCCGSELVEGEDVFRLERGSLYCAQCAQEHFTTDEFALLCNDVGYVDTEKHKAVFHKNDLVDYLEDEGYARERTARWTLRSMVQRLAASEDFDDANSDITFWTTFAEEADGCD